MKDFLKHIWDRKGKLIFLLFVSVFSGLVLYTIFSDDTTDTTTTPEVDFWVTHTYIHTYV
jgi:predicted negative regulator of RcsB-dependent stress response